jgi:hypothetical protein
MKFCDENVVDAVYSHRLFNELNEKTYKTEAIQGLFKQALSTG